MLEAQERAGRLVAAARERAAQSLRDLRGAEREGAEAIRAAEDKVIKSRGARVEAERQARIDIANNARELKREIEGFNRDQESSQDKIRDAIKRSKDEYKNYRDAVVDNKQSVIDAHRDVERAAEDLKRAEDEVAEAAGKAGAKLTKSQQALYDQWNSFKDAYTAALKPATDALNMLAVSVLRFAEKALPGLARLSSGSWGRWSGCGIGCAASFSPQSRWIYGSG